MFQNRFLHGTIMMLVAVCMMACDYSPKTEVQSASESVAASVPTYLVMTDATYPPFEFTNEHGEIVGMEVDLLRAIGKNQGFEVQFYHHGWRGFSKQWNDGKADIAAAALTDDEKTRSYVDISQPYFTSGYRVVTMKPEWLKKWQSQTIAVANNDDTAEDLEEIYGVNSNQLKKQDSLYLSLTALVRGQVSVAVGDATVMMYYMNSPTFQNSGYHFSSLELLDKEHPETDYLVFGVKKGNQELLNKINTGLMNIKQNGEYEQILKKWRILPAS